MSIILPLKPNDRRGFRIGVICAFTTEAEMVEGLLDKDWSDDGAKYYKIAGDPNTYTTGAMAGYNIVLAYGPSKGKISAAQVALGLRTSFTGIRMIFVVGVCGVAPIHPESEENVILGDCIISTGVIQYDLGRKGPGGFHTEVGFDNLGRADLETRTRNTKLMTTKNRLKLEEALASHLQHLQKVNPDRTKDPGRNQDRLFEADYIHRHRLPKETCEECMLDIGICGKDCQQLSCDNKRSILRTMTRIDNLPKIHFGFFGSADMVLQSGLDRDKLSKANRLVAFEMEAAGVWEVCPTVLIKAASDYADSHKNKKWQGYAAAVAAAGLKAFLQNLELPEEGMSSQGALIEWMVRMEKMNDSMAAMAGCLQHKITEAETSTEASINVNQSQPDYLIPFALPYLEIYNYVDRPKETGVIRRCLAHNTAPTTTRVRLFTVQGLGGVGKTQLMLHYASLHRQDYSAILWFDGSSHSAFRKSFIDNARKIPFARVKTLANKISEVQIDLPNGELQAREATRSSKVLTDQLISATIDWLNLAENRSWLLLFDNVDRKFPSDTDQEAFDIFAYTRQLMHGSIIMTTRFLPYCKPPMTLSLGPMDKNQALQMLASATDQDPQGLFTTLRRSPCNTNWPDLPKEAKDLADALGYLPLALSHVSSCIFQNGWTFAEYLSNYQKQRLRIMSGESYSEYANDYKNGSVATTWIVSYECIQHQSPLSAQFLQILAYLSCKDIAFEIFKVDKEVKPESDLEEWLNNPPALIQKLYSHSSFSELTRPLVSYSFLQPRAPEEGGYTMHPLVQEWSLFTSTPEESLQNSILALQILGHSGRKACRLDSGGIAMQLVPRLAGHVSRCLELISPEVEWIMENLSDMFPHDLLAFGLLFASTWNEKQCITAIRRSFESLKRSQGIQDPRTRYSALILSRYLAFYRLYEEAESVLQDVLEHWYVAKADRDELYYFLRLELGRVMGETGRIQRAESLFRGLCKSLKTSAIQELSVIFNVRKMFADFLNSNGRAEESVQLYLDALDIKAERNASVSLGSSHAMESVALIYWSSERALEVVAMVETFISKWKDAWPVNDESRFRVLHLLGRSYYESAQLEQAEEVFRKLEQDSEIFGSQGFVLDAQHWLGRLLYRKGRHLAAEHMLEKSLKGQVKLLGEEDLYVAETRYRLALTHMAQKRFDTADKLLMQAIEGRKANQRRLQWVDAEINGAPQEDDELLSYIVSRGRNLFFQNRISESKSVLESILRSYEKRSDRLNPLAITAQGYLIFISLHENNYHAAEAMSRKAFQSLVEKVGREAKATLLISDDLAKSLRGLKRYSEAEELLRENLKIVTADNPVDPSKESSTIRSLAQILQLKKEFAEAEGLWSRTIISYKERYGESHELTMEAVNELASCFREQDKYASAEPLHRQIYENTKARIGNEAPTLDALNNLALTYLSQGLESPSKLSLAIAALEECYALRQSVLGPNHIKVQLMTIPMAEAYFHKGQLAVAADLLLPSLDKIMALHPTAPQYTVEEMLMLQGEIYWKSDKFEDARISYRRLVALSLYYDDFPPERSFWIRAQLEPGELEKYIALHAVLGKNKLDNQHWSFEESSITCNGDECACTLPDDSETFYHCLQCLDVAVCRDCLTRLHNGQVLSECSKEHRMLEVSTRVWTVKGFPLSATDDHGLRADQWLSNVRAEFLDQMRRDDAAWMEWIDRSDAASTESDLD